MEWYMCWYWLISMPNIPVWVVAALVGIVGLVFPFVIQNNKEGHYWSVSIASVIGDFSLFLALLCGIEILHKSPEPNWLASHELLVSMILLGLAAIISGTWYWKTRPKEKGAGRLLDSYHNLGIVFLAVCIVAPCAILTFGYWGRSYGISSLGTVAMVVFIAAWFVTVAIDKLLPDKPSEQTQCMIIGRRMAKFIRILIPVIKELATHAQKGTFTTFRPWWKNVGVEVFYGAIDDLFDATSELLACLNEVRANRKMEE